MTEPNEPYIRQPMPAWREAELAAEPPTEHEIRHGHVNIEVDCHVCEGSGEARGKSLTGKCPFCKGRGLVFKLIDLASIISAFAG